MIIRIRTLEKMPYAQAKIRIYDDGSAVLVSYQTEVAKIDSEGWVTVRGLYSATTRRHISAFASEYKSSYAPFKKSYTDGLRYNIYTGVYVNQKTGEIVEG